MRAFRLITPHMTVLWQISVYASSDNLYYLFGSIMSHSQPRRVLGFPKSFKADYCVNLVQAK